LRGGCNSEVTVNRSSTVYVLIHCALNDFRPPLEVVLNFYKSDKIVTAVESGLPRIWYQTPLNTDTAIYAVYFTNEKDINKRRL